MDTQRPLLALLIAYCAASLLYHAYTATRWSRPWWLHIVADLAPWLWAACLALPLLGLLWQSPWYYVISSAAAAAYTWRHLWFVPHWFARAPTADAADLRIVTANVLKYNREFGALARWLRDQRADVVALQELRPFHLEMLDRLRDAYPHQTLHPGDEIRGDGIGLLSRHPLVDERLHIPTSASNPTQLTQVLAPGGPFWLVNVHARIPLPRSVRLCGLELPFGLQTSERREDLLDVAALAEGLPGDALILGDFNATDECADLRLLPRTWRSAFRARGRDFGFSYPVRVLFFGLYVPFPLFRIDHVFCRGAWRVHAARMLAIPGSDHRALAVSLEVPRR